MPGRLVLLLSLPIACSSPPEETRWPSTLEPGPDWFDRALEGAPTAIWRGSPGGAILPSPLGSP